MLGSIKKAVKHAYIRRLLNQEAASHGGEDSEADHLPPKLWGCSADENGLLSIGGVCSQALIKQYGTPLHVVNESVLLDTYKTFLDSFRAVHPNVQLATSYKTNPVPHVIKTLHDAGSYAEVISHFELWLALKLGVSPDKIILNGPGKSDAMLELAIDSRVEMINIDGPEEIDKIAQLARAAGIQQNVGLRVVTSVGWSSQFGLSIASGAALAAFEKMLRYPELSPTGLHLHLGTGIQNIQTYVQAVREIIEFSETLEAVHGVKISDFDLGGGFGVPTVRGMDEWDLRMVSLGYSARQPNPVGVPTPADYAGALAPLLQKLKTRSDDNSQSPRVVFEPGRAITSSSQTLLLSIIAKKPGIENKEFLIADGGKNITMPLGWETHRIFAANKLKVKANSKYDVFGPLCHPGDIVVKNQVFPALEAGDNLAIMDAGAYFIPNQMNFSNPRPPIVSISDGMATLVRQKEEFEDIVRLDQSG